MAKSARTGFQVTPSPGKNTNMSILKKTRHKPQVGDVFAVCIAQRVWLMGRVVEIGKMFGWPLDCNMMYVYAHQFSSLQQLVDSEPPVPPQLLVGPFVSGNQLWSQGYFLHIRNIPLREVDVVGQHLFIDGHLPIGTYKNIHRERVRCETLPYSPVPSGLGNTTTTDTLLSEAIGLVSRSE
jgi:hypothetical protein